jgi:hypothetical protein
VARRRHLFTIRKGITMGYNRVVKDSDLTIPKAHYDQARERLDALGFSGKDICDAFSSARWQGSYTELGQGEVFTIDFYDGDWWDDDQARAISGLGDLFEPDGTISFIGEDQDQWAWRVNHKGHPFVEVGVSLKYDNVEPTREFLAFRAANPSHDLPAPGGGLCGSEKLEEDVRSLLRDLYRAYDSLVAGWVLHVIDPNDEVDMEQVFEISDQVKAYLGARREDTDQALLEVASESTTQFMMAWRAAQRSAAASTSIASTPTIDEAMAAVSTDSGPALGI